MAVYKDGDKWRAVYRFTDWTGERKQTQKRGFNTKREAQCWEREQLRKAKSDIDMTFESFVGLYREDIGARIKETTWETKDSIIDNKLIPYFGKKRISDIKPKDVIKWQNEMMNYRDENGKPYSPVYLKTLHNQLSTIFNHAAKFYGLSENPAAKAGNMGKAKNKEKEFWTKDEYSQRYIRLKSLGANYSEESIRQRIIAARNGIRILDKPATDYNAWLKKYEPIKLHGFKALYYHYLYLFGKIRKKETTQRVSFYMREGLIKYERYQKQFHFLIENNIETTEQLIGFKKNTEKNISDLVFQWGKLYDKNSSKAEIKTINSKLQKLRKDVRMCNNIFQDIETIRNH